MTINVTSLLTNLDDILNEIQVTARTIRPSGPSWRCRPSCSQPCTDTCFPTLGTSARRTPTTRSAWPSPASTSSLPFSHPHGFTKDGKNRKLINWSEKARKSSIWGQWPRKTIYMVSSVLFSAGNQAFFVRNPVMATQVKSRENEFWAFGYEFWQLGNEFLVFGNEILLLWNEFLPFCNEFWRFRKEFGPFWIDFNQHFAEELL